MSIVNIFRENGEVTIPDFVDKNDVINPFEFPKEQLLPEKLSEYLQDRLENELKARKYSLKTQKSYLFFCKLLFRTMQKDPGEIREEDVTKFLAWLEKERGYSAASINLVISSIKFFFRFVVKKNIINEQKRPSENKNLPVVLSAEEIIKILGTEKNPKHRLLLMLVYSSGLRVSEVVALEKKHIDLDRQVLYINQGKGRKDRYTMLTERAALYMKEYFDCFKIDKWIFPGQTSIKKKKSLTASGKPDSIEITVHLSVRSAQYIFNKAARNANIYKKASIHDLRHSFATHLLENGTDIRYIQTLLGHSSIRTTERYTHVAKRDILRIKSPLDSIV